MRLSKAGCGPRAACAAITLVLVALSAPAAEGAQVPDDFYGMVPATGSPVENQQMAANGVQAVRLFVNWGDIERTQGSRNWSFYDARVANLAAAGLRPTPVLFGVPPWISQRPATPPIYQASHRAAWSGFLGELAARYGPNGTFWLTHPTLPRVPFTDWEVWNEPNLTGFWDGRPNAKAYVGLLRLTRQSLRAVDPSAQIAVGGIYPPPRARYGVSMARFVQGIYRVPGARKAFDALAIHPYAARPKGVIGYVKEARRLMNRGRDRRTPIWITEFGWSTGGVGWAKSPFKSTESSQAKFLSSSVRGLLKARRGLKLEKVIWHAWQDTTMPNSPWTLNMGLVRSDGSAKPSLRAFRRLAG